MINEKFIEQVFFDDIYQGQVCFKQIIMKINPKVDKTWYLFFQPIT